MLFLHIIRQIMNYDNIEIIEIRRVKRLGCLNQLVSR